MADKYLMDGHKLIWHTGRLVDWLNQRRIAPLYIDMGVTQTCNIQCKYCYYSVPENRTTNAIPTDKLIRFLKDAAEIGVKAIGFLGDGEPMIHSGIYDSVIAGKKAGLDMAIATNGLVMKKDKLEEFLGSLAWIRFTISAGSPEKYADVMGTTPDCFDKVVDNIRRCVQIKKKNNLKTTIGMQMVLIAECGSEIVPFARLGRDLGVDYAVIKQCSESMNHKLDLMDSDYERFKPLLEKAESYCTDNYHLIVKWKKMMNKGKKNYDHCYGCEFLPQISGNGDVYNCGNFFTDKNFYIGNIIEQSFKDIVFSDKYKEVMNRVKKEVNVHKSCGINCRQNEINEYLYHLKNPPEHVNFI